jgi:hypothetical protein
MIPLTQYIVENNESAALELAKKYGIPVRDKNDLAMQLHRAMKSEDEDFIRDLASIHPDRELFDVIEEKSNCCGSGADGKETETTTPQEVLKKVESVTGINQNQFMQLTVVAVLVVAIVAISK